MVHFKPDCFTYCVYGKRLTGKSSIALKIIEDIKSHYKGEVDIHIITIPRGEYKHVTNKITEMSFYDRAELKAELNHLMLLSHECALSTPRIIFLDQQCEEILAEQITLLKQIQPPRPIYVIATIPYGTVKEHVLAAFDTVIQANQYNITRQTYLTLKQQERFLNLDG